MFKVSIDGCSLEFQENLTVLQALEQSGLHLPALCHDVRLAPISACRLCTVQVVGSAHPVTACATPLTEGMAIITNSPELSSFRRTTLEFLASRCDPGTAAALPEKPLHQVLRLHGIEARGSSGAADAAQVDDSHPYIHVDMSQCIDCFRCVRICEDVQGQSVWHIVGRGDETRIVPDAGGSLGASSCVGCGACVDSCPTGALVDKQRLNGPAAERWTRSVCGYCGVGCEIEVGTHGSRIVQVLPARNAPVNKGHLCVKGRYAFEFNQSADRGTKPMIRRGGAWQPVGWEAAGREAGTRLRAIRAAHGPRSIGLLGSSRATNEDNYVAQKFARLVLGTNNVDCCARVCHTPSATALKAMLGTGAATNSFDDIEQTAAFLLVGCNPTENHPVVGARIRQRVRAGADLIVIDPRRTELAACATVHLAVRPGTNVALFNALAHVIIGEKLGDVAFIEARVGNLGPFSALVSQWSPERAAAICGVDAGDIRHAARLYARARPAMCFHGLGVTEHVQGTEGVMCLVNLALLTGNLGRPGAGINPLRGQNNVQGAAQMGCDPGLLAGGVPIDANRARFEEMWGTRLPAEKGWTLPEMIAAAARGELKALWVIGYDILQTLPNMAATRAALGKLECLVVQDLFINETAREFGTVFLPAASVFEHDGTFMNSERRIQRVRAAVAPAGEARADWRILCDMAATLGHGHQFGYRTAGDVWDEIRRAWPLAAGISYRRLESGGLQWPCVDESDAGTTVLYTEKFGSGERAGLACIDFVGSPESVSADFPLILTTGRSLYQFNAGTMTKRTANQSLRSADLLDINPVDAGQLGIATGDLVLATSRYGAIRIRAHVSKSVRRGELFATFQDPAVQLNLITSDNCDRITQAPEYKVTAVRVERLSSPV